MKSLLLLGSNAPHVHLRLRKRLSRCTLDCGFKTSESPALRGFVGGPRALATAALYLVLKSNGLRLSKNLPAKFGFSPKPIPTNIAKKLPPQRCSKPFLIAFFSLSHKRPTFAFTGESGYTHSAFGEGSHTAAHTPKQGASLLCSPAGLRCSVCNLVMLLFSLCAQYFLYVRGEGVSLSSVHSAHSRNTRCSPC